MSSAKIGKDSIWLKLHSRKMCFDNIGKTEMHLAPLVLTLHLKSIYFMLYLLSYVLGRLKESA